MIHVGDMFQIKGEEKQTKYIYIALCLWDSVVLQVVCLLRFKSYMWSKKQRVQHEVITSEYSAAGREKKKENNNNRLKQSADRKQQTWIKVWLQTAALKTGDLPPCVWLVDMAVYPSGKEPTKSISEDGGKTREVQLNCTIKPVQPCEQNHEWSWFSMEAKRVDQSDSLPHILAGCQESLNTKLLLPQKPLCPLEGQCWSSDWTWTSHDWKH